MEGDLAGRGFDFVMGLFGTEDSIDYDSINTDTDGNSFSTMVGNMFSSIGGILGSIWGGIKNKVKMWKNKAQDTFSGWASATGGFIDSNLGTDFFGGNSESTTINDGFISKDGKVTAFNDQDDILAAKSGGPIDKLLDANSAVMGELNSVNKNQLNVLISIRDGINMLVSNAGSSTATGGSTATGSSTATGGGTEVQFTTNPLTQEFYA